jgi:hypothetical protein
MKQDAGSLQGTAGRRGRGMSDDNEAIVRPFGEEFFYRGNLESVDKFLVADVVDHKVVAYERSQGD